MKKLWKKPAWYLFLLLLIVFNCSSCTGIDFRYPANAIFSDWNRRFIVDCLAALFYVAQQTCQ